MWRHAFLGSKSNDFFFGVDRLGFVINAKNCIAFFVLAHALGSSHLVVVVGGGVVVVIVCCALCVVHSRMVYYFSSLVVSTRKNCCVEFIFVVMDFAHHE